MGQTINNHYKEQNAVLLSGATINAIDTTKAVVKSSKRIKHEYTEVKNAYSKLTLLQKAAVFAKLPTLVDAAPGSGKTLTLVYRIQKAFEYDGLKPEHILLVTFTRKAAGELTKRVQNICNQTPGRMGTFHGIMHKLMMDHPELLEAQGYRTGYISTSSTDIGRLIRELVKERKERLEEVSVKDAIKFCKDGISDLKGRGLFAKDYYMAKQSVHLDNIYDLTGKFKSLPVDVAYEVFRDYQERLQEINALDFDDIIAMGVFSLRDEKIRDRVTKLLKLVIVDEFQDTSEMQLELLFHLSSGHKYLFAVGDVDQTLYEWRNASVSQYMSFYRKSEFEVCYLEENFRSTPPIIKLSNSVIVDNKKRTRKIIRSVRKGGKPVTFIRPKDHLEEAQWVVNDIKMKIRNGVKPSEIAILFRSRRYPVFIEQILIIEQIDYHIQKSQKLFDREEIKSVIAYLRLATNPDDNLAFEQVCNYPRRRNGEKFLNEVKTYAHKYKCSYLEAMGYIMKLSIENQKFINIIKSISNDMAKMTIPHTVMHRLSTMLDLEEKLMLEHGPEEGIERHDALQVLIIMLDKIMLEYSSYKEALAEINILQETDFEKTDENQVQVMNVHPAKGLEFAHVYVVGAVDGIMPSINASRHLEEEDDEYAQNNLEEERRIFYVALSRAKDELLISAPHYIYRNGKTSAYDRTMFLRGKDHLLEVKRI